VAFDAPPRRRICTLAIGALLDVKGLAEGDTRSPGNEGGCAGEAGLRAGIQA